MTLKKVAGVILLCGALTVVEQAHTASLVPYTKEDLNNTQAIETTLEELENETELEFQNQELIDYFNSCVDEEINASNIKDYDLIEIIEPLKDNNLEDLKYFTNLEELIICNAEVDLSDLKYNQSLKRLIISNCKITNTHDLPNSIEILFLDNCIVEDNLLYLPYNLTSLDLFEVGFTNIKPKNPDSLRLFSLESKESKVDISFLKQCHGLFRVTIKTCPNIKGAEVLEHLPKLCELELDDYAPIWLTGDSINNIKEYTADTDIKKEAEDLDRLANLLVPDKSISEGEKVIIISNYLINNLKYSKDIINETEKFDEVSETLNAYPIKYALDLNDSYDEVCINYACLFQALANRVGINSTQLMSDNHTWNLVNGNYIDITSLDETLFFFEGDEKAYHLEELLRMGEDIPEYIYYNVDYKDPAYNEIYHFQEQFDVDENIGYVKSTSNYKDPISRVFQISRNLLISLAFLSTLGAITKLYKASKYDDYEEDEEEIIEYPRRQR